MFPKDILASHYLYSATEQKRFRPCAFLAPSFAEKTGRNGGEKGTGEEQSEERGGQGGSARTQGRATIQATLFLRGSKMPVGLAGGFAKMPSFPPV